MVDVSTPQDHLHHGTLKTCGGVHADGSNAVCQLSAKLLFAAREMTLAS